jgi:hypothetical protein
MTQKAPSSPDRRTEAFYFVDGKRYQVSIEGRNKALQAVEKAGFTERDSIAYLNLLDQDYLKQRISWNQ